MSRRPNMARGDTVTMKPTSSTVLVTLTVQVAVGPYGPTWPIGDAVEQACREATQKLRNALNHKAPEIQVLAATATRVVSNAEPIR